MQHKQFSQKGFSLIELLVSIAILGLVLAGIYGLLNSAYQTYMNTRRRAESQQTARLVMDYITLRLREIDGAKSPPDPWNCRKCHDAGRAVMPTLTGAIPCPEDVTFPRPPLNFTLGPNQTLTDLNMPGLPAGYKNYSANEFHKIEFVADLLPLHGFSENFTDTNDNGVWDHSDTVKVNDVYDYGEVELLDDLNENSKHDFFGENWGLYLKLAEDGRSYALMESLNFDSLRPRPENDTPNGDPILYNRSQYDRNGYGQDQIVAEGIVTLKIRPVPRVANPASPGGQYFENKAVDDRCRSQDGVTLCHGSGATNGAPNIYEAADNFNLVTFLNVTGHQSWNIRGFSVELTTAARKGGNTHTTTLTQFIIPRNLEINQ